VKRSAGSGGCVWRDWLGGGDLFEGWARYCGPCSWREPAGAELGGKASPCW